MFKGNIDNVMADAVRIAERLRETDVTLGALMKEYHCGWAIINQAILSQMSKSQWKWIRKKKLAQGTLNGGTRFKPGHVPWTKGRKGIHMSPETEFKPGIVWDPFVGSGTTLQVAARLGRNYGGSELNPEYIEMAEKRIMQGETGIPIKEQRKGQRGLFTVD